MVFLLGHTPGFHLSSTAVGPEEHLVRKSTAACGPINVTRQHWVALHIFWAARGQSCRETADQGEGARSPLEPTCAGCFLARPTGAQMQEERKSWEEVENAVACQVWRMDALSIRRCPVHGTYCTCGCFSVEYNPVRFGNNYVGRSQHWQGRNGNGCQRFLLRRRRHTTHDAPTDNEPLLEPSPTEP